MKLVHFIALVHLILTNDRLPLLEGIATLAEFAPFGDNAS